jgi:hypothetical protein
MNRRPGLSSEFEGGLDDTFLYTIPDYGDHLDRVILFH